MPAVRPTVTSPSLASPSEPPSAVRSRSGMCSKCPYWMEDEGRRLGGKTHPLCFRPQSRCHGRLVCTLGLYDSDRDSDCGTDHTHKR